MSTMSSGHILTRYDLVCPAVFLPLDKLSVYKGRSFCTRIITRASQRSVRGFLQEPNPKHTLTRRATRIPGDAKAGYGREDSMNHSSRSRELRQHHGTTTRPSCAGYLDTPASSTSHRDSPSSSRTTTGSSKGKISRISPRVITPSRMFQFVHSRHLPERPAPAEYTESPRSVPEQMRTPSEPLPHFAYSASSYACLKASANQLPAADCTG